MYQRERLFSRLGQFAYQSFAEAAKLCRTFRHEFVELEHWLKVVVDSERGDVPLLLASYKLDTQRIIAALDRILHTTPNRRNASVDLSAQLEAAMEKGLLINQLSEVRNDGVRTVHVLLGLLQEPGLQRGLYRLCDEFKKLPIPQIFDEYLSLLDNSLEQKKIAGEQASVEEDTEHHLEGEGALEKWCIDLTRQAREGEIDKVIGRDFELRQVIDVLLRRRQNNPLLVGEPGVGKTAVVEALACKISSGLVPPALRNARLLLLDLSRVQAGASLRGEFESRLKALIDAVGSSASPVILFCDEAHMLVGAGGHVGTGDAVNLLKPMLARGELRMVGATTWSEYKQFIEPDAALARRFQTVQIDEPDEGSTISMLHAIAPNFALHHGVTIRESALTAAVRLSLRHLPTRQLPDKAISLLDTACARVALSQHVPVTQVEQLCTRLMVMHAEMACLSDEFKFDPGVLGRIDALQQAITEAEQCQKQLSAQQAQERGLVMQLQKAQRAQPEQLPRLAEQLESLQEGVLPLVYPWVDERVVAQVLSDWTGIPATHMFQNELDNTLNLKQLLAKQIFGQEAALREIAQAIQVSRAGIQSPERPLGVFMLSGPSGVGKTETAIALAETMYGGAHNLIVFNMSEFQEAHTVSTLKGAPPGYVGYGKGGRLTEAVRRKPYSIVLLDEFDKAHPDIHETFYQVFDKGVMEDGEGRMVSFRQCFILMTCNVGAAEIEAHWSEQSQLAGQSLRPVLYDALSAVFPAPLLARVNIIAYAPLSFASIVHIAGKQLARLQQRLIKELGIELDLNGDISAWIAQRVSQHPSRARGVESLLQQAVLAPISEKILRCKRDQRPLKHIQLTVDDDNLSLSFD